MSPGGWLSDLCQERYEVREKKTSKKVLKIFLSAFTLLFDFTSMPDSDHRVWMSFLIFVFWQKPRGLKAMGTMESDSE